MLCSGGWTVGCVFARNCLLQLECFLIAGCSGMVLRLIEKMNYTENEINTLREYDGKG